MVDTTEIMKLWNQGLSGSEIARQLHYTSGRMWYYLYKMGLHGHNFNFFDPTDKQENILIGSVLGDGCLSVGNKTKNAILIFGHGDKQHNYLCWKAEQFGTLFQHNPRPYLYKNKKTGKSHLSWHTHSRLHPWLTDWYHRFYPEGKKIITEDVLSRLDNLGLAIWWCDDGSTYQSEKFIGYRLHVGAQPDSTYELIYCWFKEQGFDLHVHFREEVSLMTYTFRKQDSLLFREEVIAHIPDCMMDKFNGGINGSWV